NPRLSITWLQQPAQHPNHRGLSGTVWSEKSEDRAFPHLEAYLIDSGKLAESFGQPLAFDHYFLLHPKIALRFYSSPRFTCCIAGAELAGIRWDGQFNSAKIQDPSAPR